MGPGDLAEIVAPLTRIAGGAGRVLVGPDTGDDAGVYLLGGQALVATVDFITPVCDDPSRFGRVAAANSISDVYAMGGSPLFAMNLCCFPKTVPNDVFTAILEGGAGALRDAGAALIGGHTVLDAELKFGLAVIGTADPERLLTNAGAREGDRLVLTKPLGTGVMINAFKAGKLDAGGLEPALVQMERLNDRASALALDHDSRAATDITGFGLAGHGLGMARASGVALRISFDRLPIYECFAELVALGVSTGSTRANRANAEALVRDEAGLDAAQEQLLYDPQTSGGLLIAVPAGRSSDLVRRLEASGHRAAEIGEVVAGEPTLTIV